jgi:hypothetical protein
MDPDLKQYLENMETRLRQQTESMETRLRQQTESMETRLRQHVSFECEKVETKLLAEFWKWGRTTEQKIRRVEFSDATTVERMAILEERVFTLERKAAGSKE